MSETEADESDTKGLAHIEIAPTDFDQVEVSEKAEYTHIRFSDGLESIGLSVLLTEEATEELRNQIG